MKPIDRKRLEFQLGGVCNAAPPLLRIIMNAAATGHLSDLFEEGNEFAICSDGHLIRELRLAARGAKYVATRLAGLAGAHSRKPRSRRKRL